MPNTLNMYPTPTKKSYSSRLTSGQISTGLMQNRTFVTVSQEESKADYTTIQDALDNLPSDGGTVYVRAGTYAYTSGIDLPDKDVEIICENGVTFDISSLVSTYFLAARLKSGKYLLKNFTITGTNGSPLYIFTVYKPAASTASFQLEDSKIDIGSDETILWVDGRGSYGTGEVVVRNVYADAIGRFAYIYCETEDDLIDISDNVHVNGENYSVYIVSDLGNLVGTVNFTRNQILDFGEITAGPTPVDWNACFFRTRASDISYNNIVYKSNPGEINTTYAIVSQCLSSKIVNNTVILETANEILIDACFIFVARFWSGEIENIVISGNILRLKYNVDAAAANQGANLIGVINLYNASVTNNAIYVVQGAVGEAPSLSDRRAIYIEGGSSQVCQNIAINANNIHIDNDEASTIGVYLGTYSQDCNVVGNVIKVGAVSSVPVSDNGTNNTVASNTES